MKTTKTASPSAASMVGTSILMFSRWAFNTDLNDDSWIKEIWADNPRMSKYLCEKWMDYLEGCENGHEALMYFIGNLDDNNSALLSEVIVHYVTSGWIGKFEVYKK